MYVNFERKILRNVDRRILHFEDPVQVDHDFPPVKSIVHVKPHIRSQNKTREYRVRDSVLSRVLFLMENEMYSDNPPDEFVNILDGKQLNTKLSSKKKDNKGVTEPKLIRSSMDSIHPRIINKTKALEFLKSNTDNFRKKVKYLNAWTSVLFQGYQEIDENLIQYKAAYEVLRTGRISEFRGGYQAAPRPLKDASYKDIPELYNYDIKSAHLAISIPFLKEAGIDCTWQEEYLNNPKAKFKYAKLIGISVDGWKESLIAILYGAGDKRVYSLMIDYCNDNGIDLSEAEQLTNKILSETQELRTSMRRLSNYFLKNYSKTHGRKYKDKQLVRNSAKKNVYIEDYKKNKKARLTAFILQGMEAAFIHHLTALGDKYSFKVIGNEHDGLITIGSIPSKAIEEARSLSGIGELSFEEKGFI